MNRFNREFKFQGQAMTEFLIVASFVLLPMLLGLTMLAKYIDIKQTAVQAARYQAWEYTVWYASDDEMMSGFSAVTQPKKTVAETRAETRRRFYTNPNNELDTLEIKYDDSTTDWTAAEKNPYWVNREGTDLYTGANDPLAEMKTSEDTPTLPIIGDVMNLLLDILDWAFSAIGTLLSLIGGSEGFTAINTDGYATADTAITVPISRQFIDFETISGTAGTNLAIPGNQLTFTGRAAVLTDGWNAGGVAHTYNQAAGTVPTTLLKKLIEAPVIKDIWNVVAVLAPELRTCNPGGIWGADDKGSLWFGYIDIDAVNPDRLSGGGIDGKGQTCNDAGMCDFTPAIPRDDDMRECDP